MVIKWDKFRYPDLDEVQIRMADPNGQRADRQPHSRAGWGNRRRPRSGSDASNELARSREPAIPSP